ncbi:hypothetical protein FJK98_31155 [Micromonospora sp. HM134]|uniref:DUF6114 domain-containing protein n=1 Tax=Micromonospora sp. HM134 TaxID=2583243 RepID=UPI001198777F|nr:DUF6114 domain-containing protein [Micromonospora sp. HM134]QDY11059.1 hypothetical protein FJK98_31155 [Micromonospora sp. HM134]
MTSAQPPYAPAGPGRGWRSFRRWRRSRPFWGGLLTVLAGVEMFASTRMTLNGLSFSSGATGLYSLLIPIILVTCGLLLWFSPGQRLFYSVVAAVTTVYSLMGLNLGGFFLGLLLGLVGSALGFAWTPIRPAPPPATDPDAPTAAGPHPDADPGADDGFDADGRLGFFGGSGVDTAAPRDPAEDPAGGRDPRHLGVALLVLGLAAGALVAAAPKPVRAAAPRPAPTACPRPVPTGTAAPRPSATRTATPTVTPGTAGPSPSPSPDGNLLTDLLHGLGDLFTGGGKTDPTATPSAGRTPSPGAGATPEATPTTRPKPTATRPASRCTPAKPTRPGTVRPGRPLPRIAAEPGQPRVARQPSKLTGTRVTMTGLRFEGIVDLPTSDGTLKALKFSMSRAVTADFSLVADGPAGRHQRYVTDELTVQGDVAFYATRFVGKLLGITVTLTPDLPFPDGIPITSPIPITFTDPAIDLAFVDSDTLTARPALALSLS